MSRVLGLAAAALTVCVGCSRDPLDVPCPAIIEGALVITELRGSQSGTDGYGEWIELYNASGGTIDLLGLEVKLTKIDGSSTEELLVRDPIAVAANSYLVLGRQTAGLEPDHVDYGYVADIDKSLFDPAAIQVYSCGQLIDQVVYRGLPSRGTFGLDGAIDPPTAAANDDESAWCDDITEDAQSDTMGLRGTPREPNQICPVL